jgi:hypothetical protein
MISITTPPLDNDEWETTKFVPSREVKHKW